MDQNQLTKASLQTAFANISCSTVARNLKSKSILLRDFVWSKPDEENLPKQVTESQFTFKAVKELKNLKRKIAFGLDNSPPPPSRECLKMLLVFKLKPLTFIINLSLETGVVPIVSGKWLR